DGPRPCPAPRRPGPCRRPPLPGAPRALAGRRGAAGRRGHCPAPPRPLTMKEPGPRSDRKGPAMKAFVYEKYGPPERLRLAEVDTPTPNADGVLVKVLAASVNAADWHVLRGRPLFSRATLGLLRPKHQVLGVDIAGRVEAVGGGVTGV